MILTLILLSLSIASSGLICYFTNTYTEWYFILLYVLAIPLFFSAWIVIYVIMLWFISLFFSKKKNVKKPNLFAYWFVRQTAYLVLLLARVRVKRNKTKYPKVKTLIITNHTSNFDLLPLIWYSRPQPLNIISKPSLFNIPIFGKFIYRSGFISIDRENDFNAVKSILRASNTIKENYASILLCPEGTRNRNPENGLLEFKAGGFKVAYKPKCPITVVAIKDANLVKKNWWKKLYSTIYIDICEVIEYEKYEKWNTLELSEYCKRIIEEQLKTHEK